ncbi:glycosyltransferase family 2 protein [Streptococcus didelphis]|uniref:glycosyltransferase family 2 protein n=1 Tax=Streptococcus didelphis TaxID=102886 RepID=UPI0027D24D7A|nr:glycosyltransferase family 2 protein [Streptococcus didelphis]WMB30111.1 glycosyltransferase family 2 protein [Streptococcus didelphis]
MIDIIMGTYNGEDYITEQIESILKNNFRKTQILIRDDGSNDNTEKTINKLIMKYPDKIKFISDNNKGLGAKGNFFELLKYVESEYVMFCDQDDYWLPEKIEKSFNKILDLEKNFGKNIPIAVGTNVIITDNELNPIEKQFMTINKHNLSLNNLLVENQFPGCTLIFNKATLNLLKLISPDLIEMHDWACILVAKTYGVLDYIEEPLIYYRQHANNISGASDKTSTIYAIKKVLKTYKNKPYNMLFDQAEQILKLNENSYCLNVSPKLLVLKSFISMKNQKKYKKIYITIKYNYFKSGIFRKIGQLIFI